ncbi:MAG: transglycosylase domain-containing protein, partial [Oscillibacter sp.]|nr:transglycosylase domain-containing protein [Oscillibacter sp.]
MAEHENGSTRRRRRRSPLRIVGAIFGKIFFLIGTLCLIGVCTAGVFAMLFMTYVQKSLGPSLEVDPNDYTLNQSSIIYYHDDAVEENDGWVEYKILHDRENRILIKYDQMAPALGQAAVAIEDHRFYEHKGVDWKRTGGAVIMSMGMRSSFGGSTITQQMLKNMTGSNQNTVNRKVTEIFRALEFEKNHTKEEILELYLNTIYFGMGCYGVQTAAQYYFGKDAIDLSVAECASIIAITNNPSMYGPMYNITVKTRDADGNVIESTPREMNKKRQENILYRMYDPELGLGFLTYEEYEAAKAEELHFVERTGSAEEMDALTGQSEFNSWFMDQVFNDV